MKAPTLLNPERRRKAIMRSALAALLALCAAALAPTHVEGRTLLQDSTGGTLRVSIATDGTQGNYNSEYPAISTDGRYVAFASAASSLVSGDTNDVYDIFVHDCQTGATTRVSVATGGAEANDHSAAASISADGRYVAFESFASNLVTGDTNDAPDVFVHDRDSGETTRISVATGGAQVSDASYSPSISADGRYVAFESAASTLVSGDTNGAWDVFVHDRDSGETTRVSVATGGAESGGGLMAAISADGRYVAFVSYASDLVSGDTNSAEDIFVHDRQTGETARVSVATGGAQANDYSSSPSISADGRYVTFHSLASNLVSGDTNSALDVFVHDRDSGETTRVSVASGGAQANGQSEMPSLSGDGRYVAFQSGASDLVSHDTAASEDVFVHDRQTGETTRVSRALGGAQASDHSFNPSISADGSHLAFGSWADNLVSGDTNGVGDVFVHEVVFEHLTNAGMELDYDADKVPDGWKISTPSGKSKMKCNKPLKNKYYAHTGTCAVVLASTGAKEALQQTYTPVGGAAGDQHRLTLWASGSGIPTNATARAVVLFKYNDGTKEKLILLLPTGDYAYQQLLLDVTAAKDYASIKVKIEYAASGGKLSIDDVSLVQTN